jgi:hypothetical protein
MIAMVQPIRLAIELPDFRFMRCGFKMINLDFTDLKLTIPAETFRPFAF